MNGLMQEGQRRPVGPLAQVILQKVWAVRLRRSGFRDLETPADARLSNRKNPSRTLGCVYSTLDPDPEHITHGLTMEEVADHYRRMEHLAARFDDAIDHDIAVAISDGRPVRRIKAELGVGQHRIERVAKQLRLWMAEPAETDGDGA